MPTLARTLSNAQHSVMTYMMKTFMRTTSTASIAPSLNSPAQRSHKEDIMQIIATMKAGAYSLTLDGAPPKSVIELRLQNTLNGMSEVQTVTADGSGKALIATPVNFGGSFSLTARLLTESNDLQVHDFILTVDGDDLHYTQPKPTVTTPPQPSAALPVHESEV